MFGRRSRALRGTRQRRGAPLHRRRRRARPARAAGTAAPRRRQGCGRTPVRVEGARAALRVRRGRDGPGVLAVLETVPPGQAHHRVVGSSVPGTARTLPPSNQATRGCARSRRTAHGHGMAMGEGGRAWDPAARGRDAGKHVPSNASSPGSVLQPPSAYLLPTMPEHVHAAELARWTHVL